MKTFSLISIIIFGLAACGLDGGTHGSIKTYSYPVAKNQLEKVVADAIKSNGSIRRTGDLVITMTQKIM